MTNALTLPPALFDTDAIDRANLADSTRVKYRAALAAMMLAGINPLQAEELTRYAQTIPPSARAHLKAALKIITADAAMLAKGNATPENVHHVQSILWRLEAMDAAITANQPDPERTPHWLSQEEVNTLMNYARLTSLRDTIILGVLFGAGLRCEELVNVTFSALGKLDSTDILTIRGKGDKVRTIPIDSGLAYNLREWQKAVGGSHIARRVDRHGNIYDSMTDAGIFNLVRKYGELIGIMDLDPHDCRRTMGRLAYNKTMDLIYVRDLLGHADAKTTQKYIGLQIHTRPPGIMED